MQKIWIASDSSHGRMLTVDRNGRSPISLANEFGRAETGEIIHIWDNEDTERMPDHAVYWDSRACEYREYCL